MGTFPGHIIPGTFLFIYGIFYIVRDACSSVKNRNVSSSVHMPASHPQGRSDTGNPEHSEGKRNREEERDTRPKIESFDFDSDAEDETIFSQSLAGSVFPPNSTRSCFADDRALDGSESDETETYFFNVREDISVRPGCKGGCKKWFTNIDLIEGVLKIVCSVVGLLGELRWVDWYMISPRTGNFTNMNNWQHATMFAFFGLSGIIDIVFQTCLNTTPPSNRGKIFLSLAFWVEYLLFSFHSKGVSELESDLHRLLLEAIGVCAVVSCLDVWCYRPGAPGVRRVWVTAMCLQGTWFWHIAFTLYNPLREGDDSPWENPGSHMMLTSVFTWHLLIIILLTTIIHAFVRCCAKSKCCKTINVST